MNMSEIRCRSCGARNRVPVTATGRPRCAKCHADLPWLGEVVRADLDAVGRLVGGAGAGRPVGTVVRALPNHRPDARTARGGASGALRVAKVNVDEAPEVSARLGVQGIPTMVLYAEGPRWADRSERSPVTPSVLDRRIALAAGSDMTVALRWTAW